MRVLLLGFSGFIGSRLSVALSERGHEVICGGRHPPAARAACHAFMPVDFARAADRDPTSWRVRLRGIDAVVNAIGIFQQRGAQRFEDLHVLGPAALHQACSDAGLQRVLQISALGADEEASAAYHLSKRQADESLLARIPGATVVQPSLVHGPGGMSAAWFTLLASLPWIPVPGGEHEVQPVHVDDVVDALVRMLESPGATAGRRIALVGPRPLSLRAYLAQLRIAMGLPEARFLTVAPRVMDAAAWLGSRLKLTWLNEGSWHMLRRGNTGSAAEIESVLGRPPKDVADFIAPHERSAVLTLARLGWLLPLCRWSLAVVWLVSGVVSVCGFPLQISMGWLSRVGVPASLAGPALWGAAGADVAMGAATLLWPRRRLWEMQAVLVLFYMVVITWRLPEFWLHPYGPILKNLPILAMLLVLHSFEERR